MITVVLSTIAKLWKEPKCSLTDEWIKTWYIYPMEYYSATRKNEILPFATMWVELECIMLSEISQVRERQIPFDFTHMWNLRNKIDEHMGRGGNRRQGNKLQESLKNTEQTGLMEGGGWEMA